MRRWQLIRRLYAGAFNPHRHPELVSGSISQQAKAEFVEGWMLKQVQHDGVGGLKVENQTEPCFAPNTQLANARWLTE